MSSVFVKDGVMKFDKWAVDSNGILKPQYSEKDLLVLDYKIDAGNDSGIEEVLDQTSKFLEKIYVNDNKCYEARTVLDEAVRNHAKHSLLFTPGKNVFLDLYMGDASLSAIVLSYGEKFSPENAIDSYKTATDPLLFKQNGRGLFLMKNFTDQLIIFFDEEKINPAGYMTQTSFRKSML